jgi:scyllo-inositol 2-dehydrogenase (NADP+)
MALPIQSAIASFGMSGKVFHGPLLHAHAHFKLAKILERNREESRALYPETDLVRAFDALCKDDSIELIVVNTPDHTHTALVRKALTSGKHVVVEKPFTLCSKEALELCELAEENKLVLSVFQNRRWDGDFLTVKKVLENKWLGRLVSYESHFDRYRNFIQPDTWKEDSSTGSGTLYNLGSHMLDQALQLFGKPLSVFADVRTMRTGSKVDDSFDVWLEYPDVKVLVRGSYLVKEAGPRYILHGTEGSFLKWGIDPQEEALKNGRLPGTADWGKEPESDWGLLNTSSKGKDSRTKIETLPGNYLAYYDNVYQAIRHGKPLAVTAREAALVIRVIEAALESATTRAVKFYF